MSEVAEKAAEVTAEVVEESIDGVIDTLEIVRNNPVALVAVGVLGLTVGGVGGYFIAKKKLEAFYEQLATEEIADAKEFYKGLNKVDDDGVVLTPQEVLAQRHGAEAAAEAARTYQGRKAVENMRDELGPEGEPYDEVVDEAHIRRMEEKVQTSQGEAAVVTESVETRNVFVEPNFDLDEEVKFRTNASPYVITHDEYYAAELDYDTKSLTYYEDDDTLTDEQDNPIRGVDKYVGDDNLVRFGHGSGDRNIVYVRNDRLETDFEIVKSSKSYLEDVLGIPDGDDDTNSLQHSEQRRAFRRGEG